MNHEDVLGMDNNLDARLYSVEYPNERQAVVSFEIFSDGHRVGESWRRLVIIRHEILLNGKGRHNYGQIIATAASKLAADLRRVTDSLSEFTSE